MRISHSLPATLLVLISPFAVAAQATAKPALEVTVPSLNCPIGLSAQRTASLQILNASASRTPRVGQGLHLFFTPEAGSALRSVDLIVHGFDNHGRVLPMTDTNGALTKHFHFDAVSGSPLTTSDLWVERAGSLTSVELTKITYADGSTWQHSADSSCRAVPGLTLVSQR